MSLVVMLLCVAVLGTYAAAVGDFKIGVALWLILIVWPFV